MAHLWASLFAVALSLSGCQSLLDQTYEPSVVPSASPITADTIAANSPQSEIGAREHPRILASYGGEYRDQRTERLLAGIVGKLTLVTEEPDQVYRITILNSPAVNAFALPGGYVYVTRGLLALANDSSEVAAVLAHEMAHVNANHGIQRQQQEEAETLSARVVSEVLADDDLAGKRALARSKLRMAAFSRNQELEADVIGVKMLGEAGYDPYAAARFLESMDAYARFKAVDASEDTTLDFLSSHPSAPRRVELARSHAEAFGPQNPALRDRERYLAGIEGLLFGDSPQEGFVRGREFAHPGLRIRFEVPPGFQIDNTASAVLATGPNDLAIRFDGVDDAAGVSLPAYLDSGWVSGLDRSSIHEITVNGMEAATARAAAGRWIFDVTVVRVDDRIYRFLTAAPRGSDRLLDATAAQLRQSFRLLTAGEARALQPLRIEVVTVDPNDTLASLAARMEGTDRKLELFRLLNALPPGTLPRPGTQVKIITDR